MAKTAVSLSILLTTSFLSSPAISQNRPGTENLLDEAEFSGAVQAPARPQVGIAPLASRLSLNNTQIEFTDQFIFDGTFENGDNRDPVFGRDFNYIFNTDISQHTAIGQGGSRTETRQRAWVFQLRAIDRQRTITRTIEESGALLGFKLDLSITGQCLFGGEGPEDYCTYTPGISTVPGAVDAATQTPNRFLFTTEFGEVIDRDLHESLFAEGFQRGEDVDPDGLVGISIDVPGAGFVTPFTAPDLFAEGTSSVVRGQRTESVKRSVIPSLARIDQTLSSNSREAAATRTTRSVLIPDSDEVDETFALAQLAAWLLPSASSDVPYLPGTPVDSVSNNLFYALSNARVPNNSFTMFQTGRADVPHSETPPQPAAEPPVASYIGFWLGMSPVRDTTRSDNVVLVPFGDRISLGDPVFRQGGLGTPFEDLLNSTDLAVAVFDQFDGSVESIDFQNIDDLFIQVGLDVSTQEAMRRISTIETTHYRLVPHFTFNGNKTGGESVLRYYLGGIVDDETNIYIGADYALQTETGWEAYARADIYSNPDADYFSEAELRASRTFTINPTRQFTLGAGAVVALDTLDALTGDSDFTFGDGDTRADIVGRWREGPVDMTIRQRASRDDGEDWAESTTLGLAYSDGGSFSVNAQYTPISTEGSYIEGAIGLNMRLDDRANAPVLQMQYGRVLSEIGSGSNSDGLVSADNVFRLGLQARF